MLFMGMWYTSSNEVWNCNKNSVSSSDLYYVPRRMSVEIGCALAGLTHLDPACHFNSSSSSRLRQFPDWLQPQCFLNILASVDLRSRTIWTITNLKEFSKSNMLQDHIWNAHCSRSMFATCIMFLEHISRGQNLKKAAWVVKYI